MRNWSASSCARLGARLCALAISACAPAPSPETQRTFELERTSAEPSRPGALPPLARALASQRRTPGDRARDAARHPAQTLEFFGLTPQARVLELEAGDGYYTRLLGECLAAAPDGGSRLSVLAPFVAPHVFTGRTEPGPLLDRWLDLQALTWSLAPRAELLPGLPLESWSAAARFDVVLGIRVAHTYRVRGVEAAVYSAVRGALIPQGVFAVIAHRAAKDHVEAGYLAESSVVESVTRAGFVLEARSEINANPKDTRDYPHGVWSLPPTLSDGPKYAHVGESDRMTLRFRRVD